MAVGDATWQSPGPDARSSLLRVYRRAHLAALSVAALLALLPPLAGSARAQSASTADVAKPVSLPDIVIGSPKAAACG